jgi:hypothetical protein
VLIATAVERHTDGEDKRCSFFTRRPSATRSYGATKSWCVELGVGDFRNLSIGSRTLTFEEMDSQNEFENVNGAVGLNVLRSSQNST